jgi:hypothetical protein
LRGFDDWHSQRFGKRVAVVRHSGAAQDNNVRAIGIAEGLPHLDHAGKCPPAICQFGNPELKRPVAREAITETHGANVAEVPWHGCRQYGNNAEALPERQCRQHAALRDAKNRSARLLSQRMEAGIAEAGDDKSRRVFLKGCRKSAKGINDTVHMVLRLDAWWSFFKGQAFDRRPAGQAQRLHRPIDCVCDHGRGVWVDYEDCIAHRYLLCARRFQLEYFATRERGLMSVQFALM